MMFVLCFLTLPSSSFSWLYGIHTSLQMYLEEVDHMKTYIHTHDYSRNLIGASLSESHRSDYNGDFV